MKRWSRACIEIVCTTALLLGMVFGGAAFAIGTFSIMEAVWR